MVYYDLIDTTNTKYADHRATVMLGAPGVEGFTGLAYISDCWLAVAITPMGIITEPVIRVDWEPIKSLEEFVRRHFDVTNPRYY